MSAPPEGETPAAGHASHVDLGRNFLDADVQRGSRLFGQSPRWNTGNPQNLSVGPHCARAQSARFDRVGLAWHQNQRSPTQARSVANTARNGPIR